VSHFESLRDTSPKYSSKSFRHPTSGGEMMEESRVVIRRLNSLFVMVVLLLRIRINNWVYRSLACKYVSNRHSQGCEMLLNLKRSQVGKSRLISLCTISDPDQTPREGVTHMVVCHRSLDLYVRSPDLLNLHLRHSSAAISTRHETRPAYFRFQERSNPSLSCSTGTMP